MSIPVSPTGIFKQTRGTFSITLTNSFTATLSHFTGIFKQSETEWKAALPFGGIIRAFPDGFASINSQISVFPQGRIATQYQFTDDFSWHLEKALL